MKGFPVRLETFESESGPEEEGKIVQDRCEQAEITSALPTRRKSVQQFQLTKLLTLTDVLIYKKEQFVEIAFPPLVNTPAARLSLHVDQLRARLPHHSP